MADCIFCRIIKGEVPCTKIYEDNHVFAFLDIRPAGKKGGHTLVMPKKHYELITDVPEDTLAKLVVIVKKISAVLMKDSEGVNIVQNNKKAAGQFVPHVHFHVIPRVKNDGITIESWKSREYKDGEAEREAEIIRKAL